MRVRRQTTTRVLILSLIWSRSGRTDSTGRTEAGGFPFFLLGTIMDVQYIYQTFQQGSVPSLPVSRGNLCSGGKVTFIKYIGT
jgi:hypothetical protein